MTAVVLKVSLMINFSRLFSYDPLEVPSLKDYLQPEVAELRYNVPQGWFDSSCAVLLHLCKKHLNETIKITAEANNIDLLKCYHVSCRFVDQYWHIPRFDLERRCESCSLRLCLRISFKYIFNILD